MDNLALKAGLGYSSSKMGDVDASTAISYRLGAKYYVMSKIPVTLDVTFASTEKDEDPMWLGIGAGYAFFLGDNVSIEPGLRYNMNLNSAFEDLPAVIQFNVALLYISKKLFKTIKRRPRSPFDLYIYIFPLFTFAMNKLKVFVPKSMTSFTMF